jgi:fructan beta-fructosidase
MKRTCLLTISNTDELKIAVSQNKSCEFNQATKKTNYFRMKCCFIALLFILISVSLFSKEDGKEVMFNEGYRPQYHFSPNINQIGSPISMMQTDSVFNLFYQWNPLNLQPGFVNWGHASSTDLIKWKQEGISISRPVGESDSMKFSPWWGSAVQKGDNKYAWVNSWGEGIFRYKGFHEGKWTDKEKTNGTEQFLTCEPFVFWHGKTNKWVMVAFNRSDSTINFLNSPEGLNWNKTSTFNFKFGFASMFELPVDRKTDDTRFLLLTEKGNYMLGKFDGEKFELLSPIRKFDYGRGVGGTICFTDKQKSRTLLVSELMEEQLPDLPSNGQLSFPTELFLHEYPTGVELQRRPIEEIKKLIAKSQSWTGKKIYPGLNNNILSGVKGGTLWIKGIIDLKNCDQFGFIIRSDRNLNGTEINYLVSTGQMSMLGNKFNYKPENNKIEFEILVDRSSIELLVDGGRYVISSTFAPDLKSLKYGLYTIGGEIVVDQMEVNQLKSAWNREGN